MTELGPLAHDLNMKNDELSLESRVTILLDDFVNTAVSSIGKDLRAIYVYGSAAENRLRATSDVNLILILKSFSIEAVNSIREKYRNAHAAIKLRVMFVLESELGEVSQAFPLKFEDINSRHKLLFGENLLKKTDLSRDVQLQAIRQNLLNIQLRLREQYVLVSLRPEQLGRVISEMMGPLRACTFTMCNVLGVKAQNPRESLEICVSKLENPQEMKTLVSDLSKMREFSNFEKVQTSPQMLYENLLELIKSLLAYSRSLSTN